MDKYHYTQAGLDNVWLVNGFEVVEAPYGKGIAIENVKGLHQAIGIALTEKPRSLTGQEFRFLRKELELSQNRLGELMGKTSQTIANWEKSDEVPETAGLLIRHIYKQTTNGRESYVELVDHLKNVDLEIYNGELAFQETEAGWKKAG